MRKATLLTLITSIPFMPAVASAQTAPRFEAATTLSQVADSSGHPQTREGFWFNLGLGVGSLGCRDCVDRETGLSGNLSLGGTLTDRLILGFGTTGWAKDVAGELLTVGTMDARFRFYPVRTSGFFITGGLGVGSIRFAGESELGAGVVIGLGWDIRMSRNVSLTPFYNGFAMSNETVDANVGQAGIGFTIH